MTCLNSMTLGVSARKLEVERLELSEGSVTHVHHVFDVVCHWEPWTLLGFLQDGGYLY